MKSEWSILNIHKHIFLSFITQHKHKHTQHYPLYMTSIQYKIYIRILESREKQIPNKRNSSLNAE